MSNMQDESHTNISDDRLANSLPNRIGSYRSLSAKRPRKSVSFNDVPVVHEVPSYDTMRNSNNDIYRSWTYTDATTPISVMSPFSSSQILSPFNSTNAAAQKAHANRLSSLLYSSNSNQSTTSSLNRLTDWSTRHKSNNKTSDDTNEHNPNWTSPLIVVHTPDDRTNKNLSENFEEKKPSYRSAVVPDSEHYRSLPFTYVPLSDSTTTYTSMLSTNLIPSNHSSNDQTSNGRISRVRSATLPITVNHSSTRSNDQFSITPLRSNPPTTSSNNSSPRTILKPTTVGFQTTAALYTSPTSSITKPSRLNSSRPISSSNRPLSSSVKYTITPSLSDSITKPAPTTYPRSRSAHVLSPRRQVVSPVIMLDGQSKGTNHTNLYSTSKRNPNVRQTYGSYYMHHVLLPSKYKLKRRRRIKQKKRIVNFFFVLCDN